MKKVAVKDMTEGSPSKLLWKFSIPILLSVMFQQFYSIVDSIVAGKLIGDNALAAVGASFSITMIFMSVAIGINSGCSVVISQLFGGKEYEKMKEAVSTSVITVTIISIVLTIVGFLLCNTFLYMLHTPEDIMKDSAIYLNIYIGSLIFIFMYNIANGIFTALGDSQTPLYFLIASSIGNVGLNLLFVIVFHMGVAGLAWATFIAQGMASVLAMVVLYKRVKAVPSSDEYARFSFSMLKRISRIAIPSIIQSSCISVGNLMIQGLINSFGATVIAGYSAAIKLSNFAVTTFNTMGSGLSNFAAQNIGAGKEERAKQGFRSALGMAIVIIVPFFIAYEFFGEYLICLFVDKNSTEVIKVGTTFLKIASPFYFALVFKLMSDAVLKGAAAMVEFMIATFSDLILRVILAFILSSFLGSVGIWLSWPVGWTVGSGLSYWFYKREKWRRSSEE